MLTNNLLREYVADYLSEDSHFGEVRMITLLGDIMKFSELPERQAAALVELYAHVLDALAQEQREYSQAGFRLLLVANSAGVAFLATTLAGLYANSIDTGSLITPLILFLIGALFSGLAYFPVIGVASSAAGKIGDSIEKFIKDEIDFEDLKGWGHSRASLVILRSCVLISLGCLILGTILSVKAIV